MTEVATQPPLEAAKLRLSRHAWREATDRFAEADAANPLAAVELESFAEASWRAGRPLRHSRGRSALGVP